ncbi:hypothetical protein ASD24_11235 [Paenibacillus sp. Root52]|uniref:AraC-like DNA-binding protein n=1 Tax=Paenibacillus amylolyticus TaxID=1451 RepID=A0AAP5LR47_PAEAM|nr:MULTISPECIES: AraC family transcriptional regulator [Paenibacillus]KQY84319.1 hypothetical protein ASD24_11235 [Paenibacillus sp. Root52]MDR6724084.1 AraC-like DNA-binding protein [Paenibacillus amylolyticus]
MTEQLSFNVETSSLPLLSSMCRVRRGENFRVNSRAVSRPMLCLVLQGEGLLSLNDELYSATANQLFVLEEGTHVEATSSSNITEFILVSMSTVIVQQIQGEWKMTSVPGLPLHWHTGRILVRQEQQIVARFKQLYDAYRGVTQDHFVSIHSQLHELLQYVSEHRLEANQERVDPALERSIRYMHRFMGDGISMDQLAKIAHLTPSSYSRSFKKAKGMSPTDYLNGLRICKAKSQLKQNDCSIKEIAESVGYGNEYYFNRKFKQTVGISPSLYMKQNQLKVATASVLALSEHLSSLGLEPVTTVNAWNDREVAGKESHLQFTTQLDKLRRAKPDLIIADWYHEPYVDTLKSIAPTVVLNKVADWRKSYLRIGELVGREKQALSHIKELAFRILETSKRLQTYFANERITLVQVTSQLVRIQGTFNHPLPELLYGELGLQPAQLVPPHQPQSEFLAESTPLLDTDHLLIQRVPTLAASEKVLRRMKQTAGWNRSPAVLDGNVHDIHHWFEICWTPRGQIQIMNELEQIAQQYAAFSQTAWTL